jgi:predicted esterase
MTSRRALLLLLAALACGACSETPTTTDDAGTTPSDSGAPGVDSGPIDAGPIREDPTIPASTGTCPDLATSGTLTFAPTGLGIERTAQIWVSEAAATMDGPLVFFWHGNGGSPTEATYALGQDTVDAILAEGGIVVAPIHDPGAGTFPWYLTGGAEEHDLVLADEIVACASETIGIDTHRIHSIGFSAGALHTSQMSFRRASYVASVVTFSGGLLSARRPPTDAADARFAAMIVHGGMDDLVVINFKTASESYLRVIQQSGHFGFICDHGMRHTVPGAARASAWQFLRDHPYGAQPATYANGIPDGFYEPCALPTP